jgi:hypothetical protein
MKQFRLDHSECTKETFAAIAGVVLALVFFVGVSSASDWQTGKIVDHPAKVRDLLANVPESEQFHDGEYICLKGDANHAPDCRKITDWFVTEQESYTDVILADGQLLRVERTADALNIFTVLVVHWSLGEMEKAEGDSGKITCTQGVCSPGKAGPPAPTAGTFRYKLGKMRKDGLQEIEIEIPPSTMRDCWLSTNCKVTKSKGVFKPAPKQ